MPRPTVRARVAMAGMVASIVAGLTGLAATPASAAPANVYPGGVYGWGGDEYRQLGNGLPGANVRVPTSPVGIAEVDKLAGNEFGVLARTADGWFGWGNGAKCNGVIEINSSPVATAIPATVSSVAGHGAHWMYVHQGSVYGCGANNGYLFGQSGSSRPGPALILEPEEEYDEDGNFVGMGPAFVDVATGLNDHFALRADGVVFGWGQNLNGALGVGGTTGPRTSRVQVPGLAGVRAISTYYDHTLALKADGTVLAAGQNFNGQLGNGSTVKSATPVPVTGLTDVVEIATGRSYSMALRSDGTVWTWGYAEYGQLGTGASADALTPQQVTGLPPVAHIAAGGSSTRLGGFAMVVTTDGDVYGWGANYSFQFGNTFDDFAATPVPVVGAHGVVAISANTSHVSVLRSDHTVASWGDNTFGIIGNGVLPQFPNLPAPGPAVAPGNAGIVAIEAGEQSVLALTDTGAVLAWGANDKGQLGNGTLEDTSVPTPVSGLGGGITAIASTTRGTGYAVADDGTVLAWGANQSGQLGDGTFDRRLTPAPVAGLGGPAVAIAGGLTHALALMADGTVRAWGGNGSGQLGDGTTEIRFSPVQVQGLTDIVGVAANSSTSFAVSATGQLYAWGSNQFGELGDGTSGTGRPTPQLVPGLTQVTSVSAGGASVMALDASGSLWAWGSNGMGELGDGTTNPRSVPQVVTLPQPAIAVSARHLHVVALLEDGSVRAWGANDRGQLGNGTIGGSVLEPAPVPGLPPTVVAVSASAYSTYAIAGANLTTRVSVGSAQLAEGASGSAMLNIPVTLDRPAATTVRVDYATANGTGTNAATAPADYQAKTGTVTFLPGETAKTVSVRVYGDTAVEPNETFTVNLTGVTSGSATLGRATAIATITNDDAASTVSVGSAQLTEGNSGSQLMTFTVELATPATSTIKVNYATSNDTATAGPDYVALAGSVSFPAGTSSTTVSVKVLGDPIVEADEAFHLTLTGVASGPGVLGSAVAVGTIVNDDRNAVAAILDAQVLEGNSGAKNLVFTVTLSEPVTGAVKLAYATSNGTAVAGADYVAKTGVVSLAAGVTTKTFSVSVVGDRTPEDDETFTVTLTGVTQGPAVIGRAVAVGTIADND